MAVPRSALGIVRQYLDRYGLGTLADWAWGLYTHTGGGQTGMDAIQAELPNQKAFKARFPAYDKLAAEGRAMSPAEMLQYEQRASQVLAANGIPRGFYDSPQELAKFMENDVSIVEFERRVQQAGQDMMTMPADVRAQLHNLYGVDAGHLTAFFIDPDKATPIIQQKFTSAQIAAESQRAGVGQLGVTQAEHLAQLGVTDATAASGFQTLGQEQGLFQAQTQGEQTVGLDQQLGAQFGGDAQAQLAFQQRAAQRKAAFNESTGFGIGQSGVGALAQPKGA